jgi:predicted ATPase
LVGIDYSETKVSGVAQAEPEQLRYRAFHDLAQFFTAVSRGAQLPGETSVFHAALLVLEDIHWGDDGSLDFVEYLVRACQDAPLMIICLARPTLLDRRPLWGQTVPLHARLQIDALAPEDSRRLVTTILRKAPDVPGELVDLIVSRAEGNPYCVEEIIKMLIEAEVIIPDPEQWKIRAQRIPTVTVPPTLTGVLQARLDGLGSIERGVLQRAAVVGRTFWDLAIPALTGASDPNKAPALTPEMVRDALNLLQRRELVHRRNTCAFADAVEYSFKHELLREVTYESLLKGTRRLYHAQAAVWLIRNAGERVMEFAAAVAAHYEQAAMNLEAADWYGRAGQQARLGYAPAVAIDSLQKALRLLPNVVPGDKNASRKHFEWRLALSQALGVQARSSEAIEAAQAALLAAEQTGDLAAQASTWNELAFIHERLGANHQSVVCSERAAALAANSDADPRLRAELIRALHLKGWACYRLGDTRRVLQIADETLTLCRQNGDHQGMATSLKLFGVAQLQAGDLAEAENSFSQGLALAQELDDRRNVAAMWSNLGEAARMRGDYQSAASRYEQALEVAREIGLRSSEVIYLSNLGGALIGLGRFQEAESNLRHAIALTNDSVRCSLAETHVFLSAACLHQGQPAAAWAAAEHALVFAQQSDNFLDMGAAWRALAQAAAGLRSLKPSPPSRAAAAEPAAFFEESVRVYREIGAAVELVRTLEAWAGYEAGQGRTEESRGLVDQARALANRLGLRPGNAH